MPPRPLLLLTTLSALAVPTTALLLSTYLHYYPLTPQKTRTIKTSSSLSPTSSLSPSLRIINPRSFPHNSSTDSRLIVLSKHEIGNLTDEEILARFLRGFFGGWVFVPEKGIIGLFRMCGRSMVPVGFTGVSINGPQILSPGEISRERLPEKGAVLLGGNFMVLDSYVKAKGEEEGQSFVEIGFGDDRREFAGLHRFEVFRLPLSNSEDERVKIVEDEEEERGGVQLWYSSISCNPRENKLPFPAWLFKFHEFYAQCLFRDGMREVLRN